jgi:hypothetical protein
MNRFAQGIVFFTSKRALRLLGAPKEMLPPAGLPKPARKKLKERTAKPIAIAGAAGALIYSTVNEDTRKKIKGSINEAVKAYKRGQARARSQRPATTPSTSNASSNGFNGSKGSNLSRMTREELYKLAQQKDIAGRSNMTKDQLKRALS